MNSETQPHGERRQHCDTSKSAVMVINYLGVIAIITVLSWVALSVFIIYMAVAKNTNKDTTIGILTACAGFIGGIGPLAGLAVGSLGSTLSQTSNTPSGPPLTPEGNVPVDMKNTSDQPGNVAITDVMVTEKKDE